MIYGITHSPHRFFFFPLPTDDINHSFSALLAFFLPCSPAALWKDTPSILIVFFPVNKINSVLGALSRALRPALECRIKTKKPKMNKRECALCCISLTFNLASCVLRCSLHLHVFYRFCCLAEGRRGTSVSSSPPAAATRATRHVPRIFCFFPGRMFLVIPPMSQRPDQV